MDMDLYIHLNSGGPSNQILCWFLLPAYQIHPALGLQIIPILPSLSPPSRILPSPLSSHSCSILPPRPEAPSNTCRPITLGPRCMCLSALRGSIPIGTVHIKTSWQGVGHRVKELGNPGRTAILAQLSVPHHHISYICLSPIRTLLFCSRRSISTIRLEPHISLSSSRYSFEPR